MCRYEKDRFYSQQRKLSKSISKYRSQSKKKYFTALQRKILARRTSYTLDECKHFHFDTLEDLKENFIHVFVLIIKLRSECSVAECLRLIGINEKAYYNFIEHIPKVREAIVAAGKKVTVLDDAVDPP